VLKLTFVAFKINPNIAVYEENDLHLEEAEGIDLNKNQFEMAVVITDVSSGEVKHDPRFVDWIYINWGYKDGKYVKEFEGSMHPCNEADFAKFHKP